MSVVGELIPLDLTAAWSPGWRSKPFFVLDRIGVHVHTFVHSTYLSYSRNCEGRRVRFSPGWLFRLDWGLLTHYWTNSLWRGCDLSYMSDCLDTHDSVCWAIIRVFFKHRPADVPLRAMQRSVCHVTGRSLPTNSRSCSATTQRQLSRQEKENATAFRNPPKPSQNHTSRHSEIRSIVRSHDDLPSRDLEPGGKLHLHKVRLVQ